MAHLITTDYINCEVCQFYAHHGVFISRGRTIAETDIVYFLLGAEHNQIVKHLIYPIPDSELPFLGVHLTRMIDGTVTVGPNAVLAFKREGYHKYAFSLSDSFEMFTYPGLLKVLYKNLRVSKLELKNSLYKAGYLELVRKYCPSLSVSDLHDYPAGIRAQAVTRDGQLVHDFMFASTGRALASATHPPRQQSRRFRSATILWRRSGNLQ
jgi:L-2-hydroxyglutarate oxidase